MSNRFAPLIGAVVRFKIKCIRSLINQTPIGMTPKWQRPHFDKLLLEARATLDEKKRRELYKEMALLVRDDGGAIIPMFKRLD